MKKYSRKKIGFIVIAGLVCVSMLTWAIGKKIKRNMPIPIVKVVKPKVRQYDTILLKRFDQLLQSLDFSKNTFCYEGKFNVHDGSDTTNNIKDLEFLFCKSGTNFYSKLGNTETVNQNGVNVYVQHDMKRVVLSNMDFKMKSPVTGLGQMIKTLRSEDYDLVSSASGSLKKISLINENHITCKELTVSYDTVNNKLQQLFLRFTDLNEPSNKKKERTVTVDVSKIQNTVLIGDYPGINNFIKERNGKFSLLPRFANYELIKL